MNDDDLRRIGDTKRAAMTVLMGRTGSIRYARPHNVVSEIENIIRLLQAVLIENGFANADRKEPDADDRTA